MTRVCVRRLQVLELSNARKALSALIEDDGDGFAITAAIDHARRVGVDSEVCHMSSTNRFK